ncbi:peptidyl-prolyl cis-trans isomerase C [Paracoccus alcaliphilus]|uniref:Parvulin-like PPIase n=1 Tax=Paracoccus alcaliphilus TaxID=34002 RepID=A0A1H8EV90_9RHOB|nr:peptidylprolyl isomerase [Paracoccus alcaliphilus]WCR20142.1 peptidylprolyl isomerase [Paracoccus alcaliphilus]SEN23389.1 peptidyl-prolyl cis-trans isomerase C [Paracoccus alcaliphilus]
MNMALFPDVVVNGETIPSAAIAAEAQNHIAPRDKPGIAWRKAAQAMAIRTLLLQEAHSRQLTPNPEELAPGRVETEDEALIRTLLDEALTIAPVTDSEVQAEWAKDQDPARFRSAPLWDVSHILCACDPRDEAETAMAGARAKAVLARLDGDAKTFAAAARESDCNSKAQGGHLGQLGPGDTVPEFETALRGLSDGQTTPVPILSRHGWHIIRLNAIAPGQVLPYEAVRPKIAQALEKAAWARASRDFIERLANGAQITGASLAPIGAARKEKSR